MMQALVIGHDHVAGIEHLAEDLERRGFVLSWLHVVPEERFERAGVTPSTRQSGKVKITAFRWAADKQLRDAVCDFAADSRFANPWAAQLYDRARARGHRHPHAVRIVARAWLHVIWRCWRNHQPYDPAHHRALQAVLHPAAALGEVTAD